MNEPMTPALTPGATASAHSFVAYTPFTRAEELLEEQLGDKAKLVLPQRYRESLVRYLPWVTIILLPFHFLSVLVLLGVTALATLAGSASYAVTLISIAIFALEAAALPGLFARTPRGWALYNYARVLGVLTSVLSFSFFSLIFGLISLWFAFQVKYEYR